MKGACEALNLSEDVYELLKELQRRIEISISVKMDNGSIKIFNGYRALYNDAVKVLSICMIFKCWVTGTPYDGVKGSITVNPLELSEGEIRRLSKGYIQGLYKYLGEKIDFSAPEININSQIMDRLLDKYIKLVGHNVPGTITGRSVG